MQSPWVASKGLKSGAVNQWILYPQTGQDQIFLDQENGGNGKFYFDSFLLLSF